MWTETFMRGIFKLLISANAEKGSMAPFVGPITEVKNNKFPGLVNPGQENKTPEGSSLIIQLTAIIKKLN